MKQTKMSVCSLQRQKDRKRLFWTCQIFASILTNFEIVTVSF